MFQDNMTSNSFTWYMRLLTASMYTILQFAHMSIYYYLSFTGSLKHQSDKYLPFIDNNMLGFNNDMSLYCSQEVEPMGKECEQVHIMALLECLQGINIHIEYLDGHDFEHELPHVLLHTDSMVTNTNDICNKCIEVYLLYRPGHYDVLYI